MSAVDSLAIQRSLTNLEERYHKLSLLSEERFSNWEAEKTALHQQLSAMADSLQESQQQRDQQVANSAVLQDELNQLHTAHQSLNSEHQAVKEQLSAMADSLQDSQEEAELILLQLQQVQAELENCLLKNQDLHIANQSLNSELQAAKEQLSARSDSLKDSQEEAELTLLQLHQVQDELEHYFLKNQDLHTAHKSLNSKHKAAKQQLAAMADSLQERQQQCDKQVANSAVLQDELNQLHTTHKSLTSEHQAAKQQLAAMADSLQESQQDAKQTLLKLHQVQEQLEHYYLKNQEITRKAANESKSLRAKAERENTFLRTKVEERDGLISQYRQTVEQLKSVALKSLKPHPFYLQWLTVGSRQRLSLGSNQQLLLPPAESA